MKRILLFFALFIAIPSFAQIEEEIMQSSKSAKIAQGRDYLVEKFLDRDYDKVKEIKDYLLSLEGDDYVALTPYELWHILAWTKEFDALTENLRHFDSVYYHSFDNKIFPERDLLLRKLYLNGCEDEHLIRFNLQEAQLQLEDEAAVSLTLDWLLQKSVDEQDELNEKSTRFLKDYPNSDYEWFVRHFVREVYVEKNWGWGMGLDICTAFSSEIIRKPSAGFGISFDILYKKWDLCLGYDIVLGKTKEDKYFSGGVVYQGKGLLVMPFYATLSYPLGDGHRCSISPVAGIGTVLETYSNTYNPELSQLDKGHFSYVFGACFDIKTYGSFEGGVIRIRYNCNLMDPHNGNHAFFHVVSVGGTGFLRKRDRVF